MNTLIKNAYILSMTQNQEIKLGEVWIKDNIIDFVGTGKCQEYVFDYEIDAHENLLLPGFKNAHAHSAMTFLRSFADDLPLMEWLNRRVFPMEAKLKKEHIKPLVKLAIMEYLSSGITSCFDMYMFPEEIAEASIECGFRTVLCGLISDFVSNLNNLECEYKFFNRYNDLISYQLGFHAEYTTSQKLLEGIADLANKYKTPVFTHNSETDLEVKQCIGRTGMTPTAYLNRLGIFDNGGGSYHCVHVSENDLDILVEKKVCVVINSGSNMKLASGIAPVMKMKEKGIKIALGTDGPASNNCLDMFREMFLVTGLQKLLTGNASSLDAEDVLFMATSEGAKVMCLQNCDTIEKGKMADLCMIDLHQPNMQPLNNISKNIVYSGSKSNIKMTMVNGKVLYYNGEYYINEEPEKIYWQVNKIIDQLK